MILECVILLKLLIHVLIIILDSSRELDAMLRKLHAHIVQLFSFDRAEQPVNLNNGKFPFTIHCLTLVLLRG